jgi:asparagine synthase (glutamine-hydrolysing)
MCGFVGCWSDASREAVIRLAASLRHRGPDAEGAYASPDGRVAFAHRRLSIVDLSTGDQPMSNEDRTIWVAFNGELYNHRELRRDLERAGHRYRTVSDTETLVHAYEQYGEAFLERVNGDFAFVLYDERRQVCLLARDRLGIRPLFYASHAGRIYFASEIKALLAIPGFSPRVNAGALDQYLALRYSSGPQSMFEGIYRLPPGTTLRLDVSGASPQPFWRLPQATVSMPEEEAVERLDQLLADSVQLRLMSDVPLGMYLSGGVDSGLILALMARYMPDPVRTFSIGFDLPIDECAAAREVARQFGAQHTEVLLPRDAYRLVPAITAMMDEPLGDMIVVPTYFLSKTAAQSVKVALTGEGADELFGSYVHQYALARYAQFQNACPAGIRKVVPAVIDRIPLSILNRVFPYPESLGKNGRDRLSRFFRQAETGSGYLSLVELFTSAERRQLLEPDWRIDAHWEERYRTSDWPDDEWLDSAIDVDCRHWLPDYTLFKQDRLTMANSIEGRVPFLDHRLVEFVVSLPADLKMRNGTLKYLLRRVATRYLGRSRAGTRKAAFYVPVGKFFGHDFEVFVRDTRSRDSVRRDGYFNPDVVHGLITAGLGSDLLQSKRLMALLIFTLWARSRAQPTMDAFSSAEPVWSVH